MTVNLTDSTMRWTASDDCWKGFLVFQAETDDVVTSVVPYSEQGIIQSVSWLSRFRCNCVTRLIFEKEKNTVHSCFDIMFQYDYSD